MYSVYDKASKKPYLYSSITREINYMLTQQKTIVRHVLKTFALFLLVVLYAEVSFAGIKEDTKRTDYFKQPTENEIRVSTTKYDYTDFAKKITSDSKNNYDKIKSIYLWICSNIEYV